MNVLKSGKTTKSYTPKFRLFAFTLFFYSPRAYNYLRGVFGEHLPAPCTIRSWYSSIDGSPGVSNDALEALKSKANTANSNGETILGCLIWDEIYLHRSYQWDDNQHQMIGQLNIENSNSNESDAKKTIAEEALVYMISGVNNKFKIPVAYFLTRKMKSKEKAAITKEVLLAVSKTGVKVIAMTFDGLKMNFTVCKHLGANFELDIPFIINPHSCDKVFLFSDASHMEKLGRNRLAKLEVLYNEKNEKIEWRYFESLVDFQEKWNCQLGNRLTRKHMQWFRKKMNVRMAVETLSLSVANAMEFLRDLGYPEFQGCDATVEYIKYMNNVFDVMNSKGSNKRGFKRPLSRETKDEYFSYFDVAIKYLSGLRIEPNGKSILETDSKTAYFGFIQNLKNMKNVYYEYIETNVIEELNTYRLSQDHLEIFFARIRSMHGWNDNPTVEQFAAAYRRLLVHNDVTASNYANCEENYEGILTVSSRRPKLVKCGLEDIVIAESNNFGDDDNFEDDMYLIDTLARAESSTQDMFKNMNSDRAIQLHVVVYLSSFVEREVIEPKGRRLIVKCVNCIRALSENELIHDDFLERKCQTEDLIIPCASTVAICAAAELQLLKEGYDIKNYKQTLNTILSAIDLNIIFPSTDFEHEDKDHKILFVLTIIKIYLRKKMVFIARKKTRDIVGDMLRGQYKKTIHFKGQ